jgi:NADH-quinone oxidoreductase subunit N
VNVPDVDMAALAPIGFVSIGAMVVLLGEVFLSRKKTLQGRDLTDAWIGSLLALTSLFFLSLSIYVCWVALMDGQPLVFNPDRPLYQLDAFSAFVSLVIALASLLCCALSIAYLAELRINHGEFYALVLLATAGMMLMVGSLDFLSFFVGLEMMSIPVYVLAGFDRSRLRSNESAIKYFLIGGFASAILLYGVALLYGACGSTSFAGIRDAFQASSPMALVGLGLVVVGFGFKISAVPFHQWTPDVYEGAPAAVTAFMSVTVKTAAVAALLRVSTLAFGASTELPGSAAETISQVLWVLAALSIVVGNVMAVIQENVKRLLAYSSIAHAGYLLIGIVAGTEAGYTAVLFYLVAYVFMNLGAFAVVVTLAHRGQDCERIDTFAGLARTRPGLAALMTLFLVSLAGIPGTAGFMAKFTIFAAAVEAREIALVILGVLMSVVSLYYYLRIPVLMYMRDPSGAKPRQGIASGEALIDWARESVQLLFES